jgi:hypothetical protein
VGNRPHQHGETAESQLDERRGSERGSRYSTNPNITRTLPKLEQRKDEKAVEDVKRGRIWADLSANANLAGRMGMSGAVKKATKKQTEAPNKHAPKPINLEQAWMKGTLFACNVART